MTDKILEVRGLTKTYGGDKKKGAKQPTPTLDVLKGIDIDIYRGDVVCLIGPSGCGKSTFLRCLNRLEIPTGGSIKFEGVEIDDSHIDAVRQKMGMVFQHFNLFPHLTVKQNLCLAPTLLKLKNQQEADKRAEELLARVGLSDKAAMEIMNAKILKERRNAANRASNCDTANMDKVAGAAAGQIAAINAVGLDSLPEELRALAELRLQNPFDSLRELGQKLTPPLSRSGVNHRLEKIIDLAARKD